MRLSFTDNPDRKGVVDFAWASCGPLHYSIQRSMDRYVAYCHSVEIFAAEPKRTMGEAKAACESHLQAILDGAAELDAAKAKGVSQ